MQQIKRSWLWLFVVGALFVLLNWQIPLVIDDYPYSRSWVGITQMDEDQDINATIESVADLFNSQVAHYQVINGRALVHTLVQVFCCWAGQVPFDLLQGVMLVLCIVLIGRLLGSRQPLAGTSVMLLMMVLYREPSCIYHGIACGVNYLWVMALVLGVRWMYLHQSERHPIWLALLAFAAGFSNEAYAIPFAGAFFLEILLQWKDTNKPQRVATLLMCLGVMLLAVAPSNFQRLAITQDVESTSTLPHHLQPLTNLRLTFLCIVNTLIFGFKYSWQFVKENRFWYFVVLLSSLMALAIGGESIRQCIAAELGAAILLALMAKHSWAHRMHAPALMVCTCFLCLLLAGINLIQHPVSQRFEQLKAAIEASEEADVVLHTTDMAYPSQIEKYRCCELSDFQIYQLKWWYGKQSVNIAYDE